jgi:hypothetical protein
MTDTHTSIHRFCICCIQIVCINYYCDSMIKLIEHHGKEQKAEGRGQLMSLCIQ